VLILDPRFPWEQCLDRFLHQFNCQSSNPEARVSRSHNRVRAILTPRIPREKAFAFDLIDPAEELRGDFDFGDWNFDEASKVSGSPFRSRESCERNLSFVISIFEEGREATSILMVLISRGGLKASVYSCESRISLREVRTSLIRAKKSQLFFERFNHEVRSKT